MTESDAMSDLGEGRTESTLVVGEDTITRSRVYLLLLIWLLELDVHGAVTLRPRVFLIHSPEVKYPS